jgi:hypothetical protein
LTETGEISNSFRIGGYFRPLPVTTTTTREPDGIFFLFTASISPASAVAEAGWAKIPSYDRSRMAFKMASLLTFRRIQTDSDF